MNNKRDFTQMFISIESKPKVFMFPSLCSGKSKSEDFHSPNKRILILAESKPVSFHSINKMFLSIESKSEDFHSPNKRILILAERRFMK